MAFVSDAQFEVGGVTVAIGAHQWGFSDGAQYLERLSGLGPYGGIFRTKYDITRRFREVRFVKSDLLIEDLRQLAIVAGTTGERVKFTPDVAVPGDFWWVDWPVGMTFTRVIENREQIVIRLAEQSPGG